MANVGNYTICTLSKTCAILSNMMKFKVVVLLPARCESSLCPVYPCCIYSSPIVTSCCLSYQVDYSVLQCWCSDYSYLINNDPSTSVAMLQI